MRTLGAAQDRQGEGSAPLIALSIAGFDPSSGAGISADLQTFAAHGLFGISAITAMTVQSTLGVRRVAAADLNLLAETLDCLEADLPPAGIKLGMLGSAGAVTVVAAYLRRVRARRPAYVVLDPVLRASSGATLLPPEAIVDVREQLLPLCDAATPNRSELFQLLEQPPGRPESLEDAARRLQEMLGGKELVVTGGDELRPNDLLLDPGRAPAWLEGEKIVTSATHGTGCAYSSALLSCRLLGSEWTEAAWQAKRYVEGALRHAPRLGGGHGPGALMWPRPLVKKNYATR